MGGLRMLEIVIYKIARYTDLISLYASIPLSTSIDRILDILIDFFSESQLIPLTSIINSNRAGRDSFIRWTVVSRQLGFDPRNMWS